MISVQNVNSFLSVFSISAVVLKVRRMTQVNFIYTQTDRTQLLTTHHRLQWLFLVGIQGQKQTSTCSLDGLQAILSQIQTMLNTLAQNNIQQKMLKSQLFFGR